MKLSFSKVFLYFFLIIIIILMSHATPLILYQLVPWIGSSFYV